MMKSPHNTENGGWTRVMSRRGRPLLLPFLLGVLAPGLRAEEPVDETASPPQAAVLENLPASQASANPLLEPAPLPLIYPGFNGAESTTPGSLMEAPVTRGPEPDWVRGIAPPEIGAKGEAEIQRRDQAPSGVLYLLNASQVSVADLAVHTTVVQKILNVRGAQNTVRLAVPFNPAFERLCFHSVTLERDGQTVDRLGGMSFRLYQKEDRAAELVFRGALQAVAFIPDLRPGDVLRYSYTVAGGHPLFGGRFDDVLLLNVRGAREKRVVRVLSESGNPVQTQLHGGRVPSESRALPHGILEQTWTLENAPVPTADADLPDWFWPFPVLHITHFQNWREVAEMFAPLYAAPAGEDHGHLYKKALEGIRAAADSERERIQAAVDLVRDDVRYLSLSEGEGGFRPRAAEEVLESRLGDCKDKTRLLCALFADLGLTAYPALVSNRERGHLSKVQASPNAFDHVVVELHWKGKRYWLDTTITQDSRDFRRDYFPYFGRALVLGPETRELTEIGSEDQATKRVRVHKKFQINGAQSPADLKVTSIYTGAAAYQERELQVLTGRRVIDNLLLETNASVGRYDALMLGKPRSVKDDLARNQLTSVEEYIIPHLWQDPDGQGRNIAIFRSSELPALLLTQMASLPRSQPLQIEHPVHLSEEIEIHSPIASEAQPRSYRIKAPAFDFSHQVKVEGTTLKLVYDYKSTSDFVSGDQTAVQLEKINEVLGLLAYSIRYPEHFGAEKARGQREERGRKPSSGMRPGRGGQPYVPVKR